MGIFSEYAPKYYKSGYSPIPVHPGDKGGLPVGWTEFVHEQCSPDQLDKWCKEFPNYNIGLGCGPVGIVALDIDLFLDDEDTLEIWKTFEPVIPYSAFEKIGSRGWTRIFQYEGEVYKKWTVTGYGCIELLSHRQTIVPPSIHPGTGAAYLASGDRNPWSIPVKMLPSLPSNFVPTMDAIMANLKPKSRDIKMDAFSGIGGRNDTLKKIVLSMLSRNCDFPEIKEEILRVDATIGNLFSDPKESQMRRHSREENAERFIESVHKSWGKVQPKLDTSKIAELPKPTTLDLPIPESGLLRDIYDLLNQSTHGFNPNWALSMALAILGTAAANKYMLNRAYSNNYFMVYGPSSSGKTTAVNALRQVLEAAKCSDLLAPDEFKSDVAMLNHLQMKNRFLYLIDEASWLLQASKAPGYYARIKTILSELWSRPGTEYRGRYGATDKKKDLEQHVWSPCISTILLTTDAAIDQGIEKGDVFQGFLNRCILIPFDGQFIQNPDGTKPDSFLVERVRSQLMALKSLVVPGEMLLTNKTAQEVTAQSGKDAEFLRQALKNMRTWNASMDNETLQLLAGKFPEHLCKLTLLHAISRVGPESWARFSSAVSYSSIDVVWAQTFLKAYFEGVLKKIPGMLTENKHERNVVAVLKFLRKNGQTKSHELGRAFRSIPARYLKEILIQLIDNQEVATIETDNVGAGRRAISYVALKD